MTFGSTPTAHHRRSTLAIRAPQSYDPTRQRSPSGAERDAAEWSPAGKVGFRFLFAYAVVYILPFPLRQLSGALARPYTSLWHAVVPWMAAHVLHLAKPITVFENGSGDTTYNYVQVLCFFVIASLATAVWSAADRRRRNYSALYQYLRIYVRYWLAFTMLSYGMAKVIKTQFPFPRLNRLLQPYGRSSPMGLIWTWMGYSVAYNLYGGLAEAVPGVLFFWRRTTTLGALLAIAVMSNVIMINFTYDVPVKLYSLHIFLGAVFLAAPELRRLLDFLVWHRPVAPETIAPHTGGGRMGIARLAVKTVAVAAAIGFPTWQNLGFARSIGDFRVTPPLYGIYEVRQFERNGQAVPAVLGDTVRWRYLVVDQPGSMSVHLLNDSLRNFSAKVDTVQHMIGLTARADSTKRLRLGYAVSQPGQLTLRGTAGTDSLHVELSRMDLNQFLLVSRGFHWVNEGPFNR